MASLLFCVMIIFAVTLTSIINGCYGAEHHDQIKQHKLLFVFGDSLFDAGNNQYLGDGSNNAGTSFPFGMSLHNHSTGRLSDGLVLPDFIGLFANGKISPPYLKPGADFSHGINFASAGASVLGDISTHVMNLKSQLPHFNKVAKSIPQKLLMRSVYLFSLGGNDYFTFNFNRPNATKSERIEYVHMVVGNLINAFKDIYDKGGRKFGIQNVGPLGCLAMVRQMFPELHDSCVYRFSEHARLHNEALSNALKKLSSELPGFKYSILDYYHAMGDRINNPTKFGFKVGNIACCGNGEYNGRNCGKGEPYNLCSNPYEYVLFDGGHHTMRTNNQLAELLWNGKPNITGPYNVKQLFDFP